DPVQRGEEGRVEALDVIGDPAGLDAESGLAIGGFQRGHGSHKPLLVADLNDEAWSKAFELAGWGSESGGRHSHGASLGSFAPFTYYPDSVPCGLPPLAGNAGPASGPA